MNPSLEPILQGSKNYDTWLAISENRVKDALKMIPSESAGKGRSFLGLWKKKSARIALDPVRQVAWELLSGKLVPVLIAPTSKLKEAGEHFPEWIRLLCAVEYNGHFPEQTDILLQETLKWLQHLSGEVTEKASGYPRTPIAGYVWMNGAIIREWSDPLIDLFEQKGALTSKANALQLKCKITGAIMAHYPQTLGPDMIAAAAALEAVGETAIPKGYYKAIITDFQPMADDIRSAPEELVTDDDILTLTALLNAYEGLNGLEGIPAFPDERAFLASVIAKGVTAEPEEAEDE
jgi:hypothetical protein